MVLIWQNIEWEICGKKRTYIAITFQFHHLPFFFLLGPFVLTNVVTCKTSGSNVFSTDIVRISKFFGSHFNAICPKSPNVPIIRQQLYLSNTKEKHFLPQISETKMSRTPTQVIVLFHLRYLFRNTFLCFHAMLLY